jgi:hypothetical protein
MTIADDPGGTPDTGYVQSYEDVSVFALDDAREQRLLAAQTECTFMWTTDTGGPVGVIMNYLVRDGRFWLTCTRRRKRVAAVEARPRVAIAISSRGTDIGVSQALTYQGVATVHDDADTKAWFYGALAARVRPDSVDQQRAFVHHLDTDGRVVIEVAPSGRIGFDSENMFKNSPAGGTRTKV